MSENIWLHTGMLFFGYIQNSFSVLLFLFIGKKIPQVSNIVPSLADEIISVGPSSFAQHPTAIKLGRALFVPLILISQLYARKINTQK